MVYMQVEKYEKEINRKIHIAWNGGYILNAELVGKLGIKESFIGSPLGLIISKGRVLSPPLFNKTALLIHEDGKLDIRRVSLKNGFSLIAGQKAFQMKNSDYNLKHPSGDICFYDLLFNEQYILNNRRVIVRLAGNKVMDIIKGSEIPKVEILPVGLTLSFSEEHFPENLKEGDTQAARLDYTDMRGPKIAAGIDRDGNLAVLAINGRIRESVGATHDNMAEILKEKGIIKAMGFDPGGSSTLVVDGKERNISPYNKNYEENVYALPTEPRAVSNAIMGYLKEE